MNKGNLKYFEYEQEKYEDDSEYVMLDSDITTILSDVPQICLTIISTGKTWEFDKAVISVGRYKDCDLILEDKKYVARRHATFIFENMMWFLRDEKSTNGTYLNGVRIKAGKKYQLRENDVIDFAMSEKVMFSTFNQLLLDEDELCMNLDIKDSFLYKSAQERYIDSVIADKYYIREHLGENGFHSIYSVTDATNENKWTMKICDKNTISNFIFCINSIIQETNILKKLSHPVMPLMVDLIEDEKGIYLVREYIEGEPLDKIVGKYGAQPAEKVVEWAKVLCNFLMYLHTQTPKYIYVDMKPSNVILTTEQKIKVVDLGSIRICDKDDDMCNIGTIGYAAPEQYVNGAQIDERTDIYGLGMTMYHLVTGRDPRKQLFIDGLDYETNLYIPEGMVYIINKCTEKNLDNRYQSAVELMNDLNNYENLSIE